MIACLADTGDEIDKTTGLKGVGIDDAATERFEKLVRRDAYRLRSAGDVHDPPAGRDTAAELLRSRSHACQIVLDLEFLDIVPRIVVQAALLEGGEQVSARRLAVHLRRCDQHQVVRLVAMHREQAWHVLAPEEAAELLPVSLRIRIRMPQLSRCI